MNGGRREPKPFLLKAGFAVILTLAGFFAARHRSRRTAFPPPPGAKTEPGAFPGIPVEELPILQTEEASAKILVPRAPLVIEEDQSPRLFKISEDEDQILGFLLPEFSKLVQKGQENLLQTIPAEPLTNDFVVKGVANKEEEIIYLKNLVQSLQKRESSLEMQLLEYHGLKEQGATINELQNRLKISSTEMKLLSLKIESLKAENEKLRAEASDYSRVVTELEMHRKNISLLKNKLESVAKPANESIAVFNTRITELRREQDMDDPVEVEKKVQRLNQMENELMKLQKENSQLLQERLVLMRELVPGHMLNTFVISSPDSVLNSAESGSLEELNYLKEENNKSKQKIEQLRTDHCSDVEELVYLRWVNACLRYELRNYKPAQERTIARDLSRCLSPNSEQKLKQLILEYSDSDFGQGRTSIMNFDLEDCFSEASTEGTDETSLGSSNTKSSKSGKSKFLGKLKKLVLGKDSNADRMNRASTVDGSSDRLSVATCTIDETVRRKSTDGNSCFSLQTASGNSPTIMGFHDSEKHYIKGDRPPGLSRTSLDIHDLRRLNLKEVEDGMGAWCRRDLSEVNDHKRTVSMDENLTATISNFDYNEEDDASEKLKLKKFAQVFKGSDGLIKSKRGPASFSFY